MVIRYYKEDDEKEIQQLFQKVFQKKRTFKQWEWKYVNNPHNKNPFILVFEEEEILGHIALWVSDAYIDGQVKKIAFRVDTMVDPEARGKGIYAKLNERMLEEAKEQGISLLYGFPAPKARDLLLKTTNAVNAGNISRYVFILDPGALASTISKFLSPFKYLGKIYKSYQLRHIKDSFLPEGWDFERVDYCDDRFNLLADEVKDLKPILLKRDADYLNWRYLQHPENKYTIFAIKENNKLKGYIVIKKEKKAFRNGQVFIGSIVDWLAIEKERVWEYLLNGMLINLKDVDFIQTWMFPDNVGAQALTRYGFKEKDKPTSLIVHDTENSEEIDYANTTNWWITQGDSDSF